GPFRLAILRGVLTAGDSSARVSCKVPRRLDPDGGIPPEGQPNAPRCVSRVIEQAPRRFAAGTDAEHQPFDLAVGEVAPNPGRLPELRFDGRVGERLPGFHRGSRSAVVGGGSRWICGGLENPGIRAPFRGCGAILRHSGLAYGGE